MSVRYVLIDAGNTRIKWATWTPGAPVRDALALRIAPSADDAELRASAATCDALWIACVAGETTRQALANAFAGAPSVQWLRAGPAACGVRNRYESPEALGVDRWLALIGARARGEAAALVVSAGTALTVDALDAGSDFHGGDFPDSDFPGSDFLGGVIVPGFTALRQCLTTTTAGVQTVDGVYADFPRSTADAVTSGAIAALAGAVQYQYAKLAAATGSPPRCLLTGGDADRLAARLECPSIIVPALVLEGMAAWITEHLTA